MAGAAKGQAQRPGEILSIPVEGMTCASCVGRVERVLSALPGIAAANVNLATERADITFRSAPDPLGAARAIEDAGYAVPEESVEFQVEGMTCASCVGRVERALKAVPGVMSASVNLATEKASVRYLAEIVSVDDLASAIRDTGYEAHPIAAAVVEGREDAREQEYRSLTRSLAFAAVLTLPVFVLEMGSHFVPGVHEWVMDTIGHRESWFLQPTGRINLCNVPLPVRVRS